MFRFPIAPFRDFLPLVFAGLVMITPARAATPPVRFPLDCDPGITCWIMALPDTDSSPDAAKDFTCGTQAKEGDPATAIAIESLAEMEKGVDVLAPADGIVSGLRDGESDGFKTKTELEKIRKDGKSCGNGILITHAADWSTQLCHLRNGSLKVKKGDMVKAGQVLGQAGLSGVSEHPHLGLTVRFRGVEIDPFTGREVGAGRCGVRGQPLWDEPLETPGFALYAAGFAAATPDFAALSQGQKPPLPRRDDPSLSFWFSYFGAQKGDRLSLRVIAPGGKILAGEEVEQKLDAPRQYAFITHPLHHGLSPGSYIGEARVSRIMPNGETVTRHISRDLVVDRDARPARASSTSGH